MGSLRCPSLRCFTAKSVVSLTPMSSRAPVARLLIVEDDATIALGLRMLLYDWGYDVMAVAASGEHALILCAAEQPRLVPIAGPPARPVYSGGTAPGPRPQSAT